MANSAKAIQIYQMFKKHLEQQKFHFEERAEELIISLTVHGDDLPQPTIIRVMDERSLVQVLSPLPTKIPEDKRVDTAVAVCVANYGMINGSFDFDMTDGEIRFRLTQSFRDIDLSEECVKYLMATVFFTTDKYNDRFFMLGKGMMTLEQFIEKDNE